MKNYTKSEYVLRIVWALVELLFFRYSPRVFYGWRNAILRLMGATIGRGVKIFPSARIMFPWNLFIGDRTVISWNVKVYNLGKITIGADTVISQYAHLCGGSHDYLSNEFTLLKTGLTIGNHVWIAADAFIGPGVTIHDGALISARAVVVKDVLGKQVVVGNPASVIKTLEKNARM